ncbi:hypothetical protein BC835DRAFT_1311667 [Cytidiella melzeri]|nr:hypothetical protein BC835DRAFT_1311667 [Cytidiella melzeri]
MSLLLKTSEAFSTKSIVFLAVLDAVRDLQSCSDKRDEEGRERVEVFELWKRDPIECIQSTSNTHLNVVMRMSAEEADIEQDVEWGMVGESSGYLPVSKMECFSKAKRSSSVYQLFHDCMRSLLAPLIKQKRGVEMIQSDMSMIHKTLQSSGFEPAGFEDAGSSDDPSWKNLPYCDIFLHNSGSSCISCTRKTLTIPKLHFTTHYTESIHLLRTADGYNSEGPERLHINFAKVDYCTSNRKQYIQQMTVWLDRQDADCISQLPSPQVGEEENCEDDEENGGEDNNSNLSLGVSAEDNNKYKISRKPTCPNTSVKTIVNNFCGPDLARCLSSPLGSSTKVFDFIVSFGNHWHSADNIPFCVFPLFH